MYETLKNGYNDKYEYIYPELSLSRNLFSGSNYGSLNLDSNLKVRTYDTNKNFKIFLLTILIGK